MLHSFVKETFQNVESALYSGLRVIRLHMPLCLLEQLSVTTDQSVH
jgi:hypothetical protein